MFALMYGLFISLAALLLTGIAQAHDIELIFVIGNEPNQTEGANYFTHTGFRGLVDATPPSEFRATTASVFEFKALYGHSISYALLQFPVSSVNSPHYHLHGAELLYVLEGCLEVGLVDTSNKLHTQILHKGDMFVFPKGLVHYQQNHDPAPAVALTAYGSSFPGTVSMPEVLFASGIENGTLAKTFKTDVPTIRKLKNGMMKGLWLPNQ